MSAQADAVDLNDKHRKRKRARPKGRHVEPAAREAVQAALGDMPRQRDLLIECLHRLNDRYGCLRASHLVALAEALRLSMTEVYEVASFYHHFDIMEAGDEPAVLTVRVCESMTCAMCGAEELISRLEGDLGDNVRVQRVPCVGRCQDAPVAICGQNPIARATAHSVVEAVGNDCVEPEPLSPVAYTQYRQNGGYEMWRQCVSGERDRESVIQTMQDSNLRGLGGAGFPAGKKWHLLRQEPAPRKVAINIDEGEPGTFKDRYFLERDPHRFIEGTLIGAWAIEAEDIYLYIRDEYTACRLLLERELEALQADAPAPLPRIYLRRGAGAYICGEESAMIESIEGKRGMPRLRPPLVAQDGVFGRPTLEQNMETMHWVRDVLENGSDWFASYGRNGRTGFRSFSVSGRVQQPGVHIAPAGITLRELIDEYCGGMADGHELYGYFPGGASGGILPASMDDVPLDFNTVHEADENSFIGSAAIIVFSQHDKARDLAQNAMRFFAHESCGQCTPCRVGTHKAAGLMDSKRWEGELLEDLSKVMVDASICGLGQAAPNPLRCVLKHFPDEVVS